MTRRHDPDRAQRIIDAALRVVGRDGIAGLSHRAVAAEADVPLGSTTYHFATLDDLLVAALRQLDERFIEDLRAHPGLADPDADLAAEVARLTGEFLRGEYSRAVLEYEIYLTALRREAVRPVAAEFVDAAVEVLAVRVDRETARALVALIDGLALQSLLTGRPYDEDEARAVFARVIGPR
ncbi:TetR family transcriptional regulator [Streptantibioticus parmotrematis]|uniref:TetR/AcrR family transcriptional regulator n=1 Tax=Streptantibioticus parmotrematis TaxID=2873249 RepID=UPI0033EFD5D7